MPELITKTGKIVEHKHRSGLCGDCGCKCPCSCSCCQNGCCSDKSKTSLV